MPIIVRFAQRLLRPCTQYSQLPQVTSGLPVTRRPVPSPATTVAANSWPRIIGGTRRGSWPCQACRSEPQMPTASMRSSTSPAAGTGSGTSRISIACVPVYISALIVCAPQVRGFSAR